MCPAQRQLPEPATCPPPPHTHAKTHTRARAPAEHHLCAAARARGQLVVDDVPLSINDGLVLGGVVQPDLGVLLLTLELQLDVEQQDFGVCVWCGCGCGSAGVGVCWCVCVRVGVYMHMPCHAMPCCNWRAAGACGMHTRHARRPLAGPAAATAARHRHSLSKALGCCSKPA
jgi:hypothetical protein